jgi:hypothetical protein
VLARASPIADLPYPLPVPRSGPVSAPMGNYCPPAGYLDKEAGDLLFSRY